MLTSWSEESTPAELSMASVLMRPPLRANSMRPACVTPRFAPFADHLCAHILGVDAQAVVGLVADIGMALRAP
jgi:hypothetical protein